MKLIVGLGNPGGKYEQTRHNIGFMVADRLAREIGEIALVWSEETKHKAQVAKTGEIMLAKPLTFMNNVGLSIKSLVDYYKIAPQDVWIIHDDIDLPIGKIRIREKGGTGGHHGIESIVTALHTDTFVRFRLGIGRGNNVVEYVLSRFRQNEAGDLKHLVKHGVDAVRLALDKGLDRAMNRFN